MNMTPMAWRPLVGMAHRWGHHPRHPASEKRQTILCLAKSARVRSGIICSCGVHVCDLARLYDTAYYIAYIAVIPTYHSTSVHQPFLAFPTDANPRYFVRRADAVRLAGIAVDLLAGAVVVTHC
jgi:hypothetical protein